MVNQSHRCSPLGWTRRRSRLSASRPRSRGRAAPRPQSSFQRSRSRKQARRSARKTAFRQPRTSRTRRSVRCSLGRPAAASQVCQKCMRGSKQTRIRRQRTLAARPDRSGSRHRRRHCKCRSRSCTPSNSRWERVRMPRTPAARDCRGSSHRTGGGMADCVPSWPKRNTACSAPQSRSHTACPAAHTAAGSAARALAPYTRRLGSCSRPDRSDGARASAASP